MPLVAAFLLLARRLERGTLLLAAWALLPVVAQALYFHHDLFMGPRLLYETGPAWCVLAALAAVRLCRALAERGPPTGAARLVGAHGLGALLALSVLVTVLYAGPRKLASYASTMEQTGMSASPPPVERPALVFVHGSWHERLGARLTTLGMGVDSIRAALRYNSTCGVELFTRRLEAGPGGGGVPANASAPDRLALVGPAPAPLAEHTMPSGSLIRSYDGEVLADPCRREGASDLEGTVSLPAVLWQGDLPGLPARGAMFVWDLGPERNDRLRARFADRVPLALLRREGELRLVPYDEGMAVLWSGG